MLLRQDGEFVTVGADGTILAGPDGQRTVVRGDRAVFQAADGYHRLLDFTGATLALAG